MIINAKVKTRQDKFSIERRGDEWVISVTSAPEGNKANMEIVKELAKRYGSARILSGAKSKRKKIEITMSEK